MDIVAIFGAHSVVQIDNGHELADAVVKEGCSLWNKWNRPWETQTLSDCPKVLLYVRTRTLKISQVANWNEPHAEVEVRLAIVRGGSCAALLKHV